MDTGENENEKLMIRPLDPRAKNQPA